MDFLGLAKVKGFMARIGPHHYGLAQCPDPVRLAEDGDYSRDGRHARGDDPTGVAFAGLEARHRPARQR